MKENITNIRFLPVSDGLSGPTTIEDRIKALRSAQEFLRGVFLAPTKVNVVGSDPVLGVDVRTPEPPAEPEAPAAQD